jgi:hypothetical protein
MQNDDGYLVIPGDEPPDELLAAVEAEISSFPRRCGPQGHQLMKFGVKVCQCGCVPELAAVPR